MERASCAATMFRSRLMRRALVLIWVVASVVVLLHIQSFLLSLQWTLPKRNRGQEKNAPSITSDHGYTVTTQVINNKVPDISDVLTHLKGKANSFEPELKVGSRNRQNVSLVVGIPHVNRKVAFYLHKTLQSILQNLRPTEATDCLVVVLYCDTDREYNLGAVAHTAKAFKEAVESGLLELIVTPASYYPDLNALALTSQRNGDSVERWKWRSRENLDAAFLMNYAHRKGRFYLMTEDDVIAEPGFFRHVTSFASRPPHQNWVILGFSEYGSKGIVFRSRDCPTFVLFLLNMYGAWPIDWLLDDFMKVLACNKDTQPGCFERKSSLRLDYTKHLFKHIGYRSSLKGKVMDDAVKVK